MIIGVPVGILTAVFLAEIADKRVAAIVKPAVELPAESRRSSMDCLEFIC